MSKSAASVDGEGVYALLLLSKPPSPPSADSIEVAFKLPLQSVLRELREHVSRSSAAAVLDIAVPCISHEPRPRAQLFGQVSKILSEIYSLLRVVYTELSIPALGSRSVNTRLLPLAWDAEHRYTPAWAKEQVRLDCVVDLPVLVESQRKWTELFTVEGEEGEQIYRQFRAISVDQKGSGPIQTLSSRPHRVPGGLVLHNSSAALPQSHHDSPQHHEVMVCDAFEDLTFTQKLQITMTAFLIDPPSSLTQPEGIHEPRSMFIGIAMDNPDDPSFNTRRSAIETFIDSTLKFCPPEVLAKERNLGAATTQSLVVRYENQKDGQKIATSTERLSAIVVREGDESCVKKYNILRREKGWKSMDAFSLPTVRERGPLSEQLA